MISWRNTPRSGVVPAPPLRPAPKPLRKPQNRREFSAEDDAAIRAGFARGDDGRRIGAALGRTGKSIWGRAARLGIKIAKETRHD